MTIPFSKPCLDGEEANAAACVIRSGWLAAGKETEAFEQEFADYVGVKYAIFTNSCTSALKMAYKWVREANLSSRENIVVYPKNTFCATYSAADEVGLKIMDRDHFVELGKVHRCNCEFCEDGIEASLDMNSNYYLVNVHYGGVKDKTPCLIEDSAHRIEPNDPLIGKIRCYSFYATKNMTTGSGGMFVTNDKEIYERARLYWKDGLSSSTHERQTGKSWDYRVEAMAGGYDGNDIAAAIGRVQLRKLPELTRRRNQIRDRYNDAFAQSWEGNHLYPYFVDSTEQVGQLIEFLKERGIGSGYHYPNTGWLGVSLPIYPDLTDDQQQTVIDTVKEWGNAGV